MKKLIIAAVLLLTPMLAVSGTWNGEVLVLAPAGTPASTTGATFALTRPFDKHTWCYTFSASPSSVSMTFQGSVDNSLWVTLDTATDTSSSCRHVVNKPVSYLRTVVTTLDSGTVKVQAISME